MSGACFEELNGHWYRCHRWVDGVAKQNEDGSLELETIFEANPKPDIKW